MRRSNKTLSLNNKFLKTKPHFLTTNLQSMSTLKINFILLKIQTKNFNLFYNSNDII